MAEPAPDLKGLDLAGLGLLAASVVGRPVTVHAQRPDSSPPAAQGEKDRQGLARSWSDGRNIHLAANSEHPRFEVLVQAALLAAKSFDAGVMVRLVGRPTLARRYLALEARRAAADFADRLPRRLLGHPALAALAVSSTSPAQSLVLALGRQPLPDPDPLLGVLHPGATLRHLGAAKPAAGAADEAHQPRLRTEPMLDEDEAADESAILKLFSNRMGGANPLAALFKALIGAGVQAGGDNTAMDGAGETLSDGSGRSAKPPSGIATARSRRADLAPGSAAMSSAYRYPEWDAGLQRYRPAHTRVEEFAPWDDAERLDLGDALTPPSREMRRQIARLGLGFEAHGHQRAGDEIGLDDLVRLRADVRAGHGGDPRIYRALRKTRRDLGVLILLDASASVKDLAPDGRSLHEHQIALAWGLAGALEASGDRAALYGFQSWGRERVHLLRVKGFDERMGGEARARVHRLAPAGFTRMGAAVRHAGAVVAREAGTPFRLVVLVTDGLSYDDGYEAAYAQADTRRALAELRARHIACLCVSVGGEADPAKLERVFGDAGFLRADHADLVAPRIGPLFAEAIMGVSRR